MQSPTAAESGSKGAESGSYCRSCDRSRSSNRAPSGAVIVSRRSLPIGRVRRSAVKPPPSPPAGLSRATRCRLGGAEAHLGPWIEAGIQIGLEIEPLGQGGRGVAEGRRAARERDAVLETLLLRPHREPAGGAVGELPVAGVGVADRVQGLEPARSVELEVDGARQPLGELQHRPPQHAENRFERQGRERLRHRPAGRATPTLVPFGPLRGHPTRFGSPRGCTPLPSPPSTVRPGSRSSGCR